MTCIVGVVHNGRAYIGGDSAGVDRRYSLTVRGDTKVFTAGPFVMGFTSSFRMGQLLRYKLDPPKHPDWLSDHEFMATTFVDAVRSCLKSGGYAEKHNEAEQGGFFLVGYRGKVYQVEADYQVGEALDGFQAVGCADELARGALYALNHTAPDMEPTERITLALSAAERMSGGVRGPFTIEAEPADEGDGS